jgi:hypothetical protein
MALVSSGVVRLQPRSHGSKASFACTPPRAAMWSEAGGRASIRQKHRQHELP